VAKTMLPDWLLKSQRFSSAETPGIPVEPDRGIETGLIYLVSGPTGLGGASPCSEKVLVKAVHPEHNYVEVHLLHQDTAMATGSDLVLDASDTGMIQELVLQADVVGVVWMDQLRKRLGRARLEILELLPELAAGRYPEGYGPKVGLPLEGPSDPRWAFKEAQVDALHSISWDCTETLLDGRDYASKWLNLRDSRYVRLDREAGYTNLVTIPEVYNPGTPICETQVSDREHDQVKGVLDPSIFNPSLLKEPDVLRRVLKLLEKPEVSLSPSLLKEEISVDADGRCVLEKLVDRLGSSINAGCLRDALARSRPGTAARSDSTVLNITVVEREEEGVLTAA